MKSDPDKLTVAADEPNSTADPPDSGLEHPSRLSEEPPRFGTGSEFEFDDGAVAKSPSSGVGPVASGVAPVTSGVAPMTSGVAPVNRTLRGSCIHETVVRLGDRINDRFPGSSLSALCQDLARVAERATERSRIIAKPIGWIRVIGWIVSLSLVMLTIWVGYVLDQLDTGEVQLLEVVSAVEAGVNELVYLAIAIVFLISLETRIKRGRALKAIHELRSIAHIIDMHQLTKDPERLTRRWTQATHSPKPNLTAPQLSRYLDYCTEMLSLTGKVAALYVSEFNDDKAIASVSDLEQLTTGLSRKIWQKIMLIREFEASGELLPQPPDNQAPPRRIGKLSGE